MVLGTSTGQHGWYLGEGESGTETNAVYPGCGESSGIVLEAFRVVAENEPQSEHERAGRGELGGVREL